MSVKMSEKEDELSKIYKSSPNCRPIGQTKIKL